MWYSFLCKLSFEYKRITIEHCVTWSGCWHSTCSGTRPSTLTTQRCCPAVWRQSPPLTTRTRHSYTTAECRLRACGSQTFSYHQLVLSQTFSNKDYLHIHPKPLIITFTFTMSSHVRLSVVCPSVVCNVRAPYSGNWNFRQCLYAIWYLGHPLTSM